VSAYRHRYDKLAANYLAFIKLAAIRIWLRAYESARQSVFKRSGDRFASRKRVKSRI
jgi:hypothetical protein